MSGGGSQLPGITQIATDVFDGLPVRIGVPRGLAGLAETVATPAHATAVGLALLAASEGAFVTEPSEVTGTEALWRRVSDWLESLPGRFGRKQTSS